ncbi:MFS transporter [Candidatus Binatus sp.]|uniref:MFS transporter n=1 Tax=Candidatus Binatus sp. TaxID=2811406 RepID=UPI003CC67137
MREEISVEIARPHAPTIRDIIRRYYTVWGMYSFAGGFLFGVYPIFLHSRGLNQFQINSVLATYFLVLFLTDVPTGAFADLLGRRRSFVLGAFLRVSAFLLYFVAHHYYVFIIAESIDGVGTTFGNGAIDAWGVDALDDAGYDGLKDRLFSRISQLSTIGFMGSAMIGAYVADVNIAWPWILGAGGYVIAGTVGAFLMHDERVRATTVRVADIPRRIAENVGGGIRAGLGANTVLMLSIANAITVAAWAPYWVSWPVMFNESLAVGVWIIGWIYCGLSLARLIGAELSARFEVDESQRAARVSMLLIAASAMLFLAGLFGGKPVVSLAMLFIMNLFTGAMMPLVQSWFNEQLESGNRATLLSFNSTFQTMGGAVGLLVAGRIADTAGIPFEWQIAGLISMCAAPVYWATRRRETEAVALAGAAK